MRLDFFSLLVSLAYLADLAAGEIQYGYIVEPAQPQTVPQPTFAAAGFEEAMKNDQFASNATGKAVGSNCGGSCGAGGCGTSMCCNDCCAAPCRVAHPPPEPSPSPVPLPSVAWW